MFRTRWSVSSDSVLHDRTTREGTMPVRFSTPLPQFGLPRIRGVAGGDCNSREKGGGGRVRHDLRQRSHIVDGSPRAASWTKVWDPFVAMSFIAAHTMARFGPWAAGRSRMSSFKISGANPIQGFTLGRCGAHCHGKRASKRPAPIRPMRKAASKSRSLK